MTDTKVWNVEEYEKKAALHVELLNQYYKIRDELKESGGYNQAYWNFEATASQLLSFDFKHLDLATAELLGKQLIKVRSIAEDQDARVRLVLNTRLVTYRSLVANTRTAAEALEKLGIRYVACEFEGGGDNGCVCPPKFYKKDSDAVTAEDEAVAEDLDLPEGDYQGALKVKDPEGFLDWVTFWYDEDMNPSDEPFSEKKEIKDFLKELIETAIDKELGVCWWDGGASYDGAGFLLVEDRTLRVRSHKQVTEEDTFCWSPEEELKELESGEKV
jgi:hypothetical protein